ncbi:rRNA maturation RNase YbeY [Chelativorans sp. YIM 93263]|uniref:rRNA maturation RNase YbeY n=1 Tax=Chelativorans sp. YIM 93263 TaxID=2906648 RepID=UPI002379EDD4|nr:rRNA maturation RNase YbeY [Chelativorans sp. YIM 93263]
MSDRPTAPPRSGPVFEIVVEAGDWPEQFALEPLVGEALGAAAAEVKVQPGASVTLLFSDDETIRGLNDRFRGKDKPTNVLSFPVLSGTVPPDEPAPLGDIALAFETVSRESAAEGKSFDHHLAHLIVHGFLHLLGYDHESSHEAEEMEDLEGRILERLAIADPYT